MFFLRSLLGRLVLLSVLAVAAAGAGGIAADLVAVNARTRERVPQRIVGTVCRRHFDWVKDDYNDGHVHADNRDRATPHA